jgi:hypothetical protein
MDGRRWALVIAAVLGASALLVWALASAEPPVSPKVVTVRVVTDENVCWIVEDGPKDPFDPPLERIRCGSGSAGYDDDLVAVPSSVVVRKTQENDAEIRASFWVNGEMTDAGETDDPGGAIALSGT